MIYVGVDLGLEGAFASVSSEGKLLTWKPMPLVGKVYDLPGVLELLREFDPAETHVVYEAIHCMPLRGNKANFMRGYGLAMIETVLAALRIPSSPVRAQAWQKVMFAGMKVAKGGTKDAALKVARRLWPSESWLMGKRTKVMDGPVDAALLAEFGRRENH